MSERRILFCNIFPKAPAAACTNLSISIWSVILVTVDSSLCTASVGNKYVVILSKKDSLLNTLYLALNSSCHFFTIVNIEDYIGNLCVELEVNTCILQIFLHWKDQGLILIVFGEFQSTEIRKSADMMDKTLDVKLHLQCAVPVFERKHGSPV